jgi:hypothetical protein
VKTPEQLPLDFSADEAGAPVAPPGVGAVVYKIDHYRVRNDRSRSLASVYESIHDAVKHVTGRARAPKDDFVESRHL